MSDTEHDFKPGTEVAYIRVRFGARQLSKRVVDKVHKTGRFTLVPIGDHQKGMTRPQFSVRRFSRNEATLAGGDRIGTHSCVEVWTPKHDQELIDNRLLAERRRLKDELVQIAINADINDPRMTDRLQAALVALRGPEDAQ